MGLSLHPTDNGVAGVLRIALSSRFRPGLRFGFASTGFRNPELAKPNREAPFADVSWR